MSAPRTSFALAVVGGGLFAAGLLLSGMTAPSNVIGFLDVTHGWAAWQPNLALVMAAAIVVYAPVAALMRRRRSAVLAPLVWPTPTKIDRKLVGGAALFGVGWGLAGYCPGPALVASVAGSAAALGFVAAMAVGLLFATLQR